MDINNIKSWLEEAIEFFGEVEPVNGTRRDIQQNIKNNRIIFGVPYRKREEIRDWVVANKPNALPYLIELKLWFEDFYHYFDTGYNTVTGETIDTLPTLILNRLKFILEKIEGL